jgi:phage terminase large subunit-like protein
MVLKAQVRPQRTARGRERAERVIQFIETLTIPSGHGQGERFELMSWQKRFIKDIYEPHFRDGRRAVRRAILSVGRKNGKTALIAGLVLATSGRSSSSTGRSTARPMIATRWLLSTSFAGSLSSASLI